MIKLEVVDNWWRGAALWKRCVVATAALDAGGLLLVGLLSMVRSKGTTGVVAYYDAVARHAGGIPELLLYTGRVAAYGALLEILLRLVVQGPLAKRVRQPAWFAFAVAVVAYGATHLIYHSAGFLYALMLGCLTAGAWQWMRDWRPLAVWHAQWNVLAVGGSLVLGILGVGPARESMLAAYKAHAVESGQLVLLPEWGWIDRSHQDSELYEKIESWVGDAEKRKEPLALECELRSPTWRPVEVARQYVLLDPVDDQAGSWSTVAGIYLDFCIQLESAQEAANPLSGMPTSAWQPEDLISAVHFCLLHHPLNGDEVVEGKAMDSAAAGRVWEQTGAAFVLGAVRPEDLPSVVPKRFRDEFAAIVSARAHWRRMPAEGTGG